MRVYIAGPMTGIENYNRPAFHAAAQHIFYLGYNIANPADIHLGPDATWQDYMRATTRLLTTCDGVALLPGWQNSTGARIEKQWAEAVGLLVLPLDQWKKAIN